MNLHKMQPRESLNKAFLKVKPNRNDIEHFKKNLQSLIEKINETESEEFHKNLIGDFLKNTYYSKNYFINTKGRNDFVIHNGKDPKSSVGVILETKKPTNKSEMLKVDNLNTKAFQELVLYFLRERLIEKNIKIKYLIATNIYEWFIFDANNFEKAFIENKPLLKQFTDFESGRLTNKKTDFFYQEIAQVAITEIQDQITFTHFDIREYQKYLQPRENPHDHKLIALFKLFSPEHLLKLPFANDSNTLDKGFYSELLHIIGLTETKEGGKKLIQRKKENERNPGSLIENAIIQLDSLDKISRIEKPEQFGETYQEQLFNVGLELAITWVNRILFLKLLEAQLIKYHKNDQSLEFLNLQKVQNYDDLNSLFFSVLARKQDERTESVKKIFAHVPYLNSSLFEPTDIEQLTIFINNLRNEKLEIFSATVLKDNNGKKRIGEINALEYLFEFLNAYDFSSESGEEIQEENKRLINASVLGLIFEKINGYKDGSFFTTGFITMYMCRETIRRAVIQKFNEIKGWNCVSIDDLYEKIEDKKDANTIINSLKICDPAVGSGHFLVSALNEMIAIKSELKILLDREGKRLKEYDIEVVNDELIILDEDGLLFEYNPKNKESQRVQETLFYEKQTIIENCLFGVDINLNSVKICRLRLWIELLKNAYYQTESDYTELETLSNIDINIKCGNSLISRFSLDTDLRTALNKNKCSIEAYRNTVQTYRNAKNKEQKREMERLINDIKGNLKTTLQGSDLNKTKLRKLEGEVYNLENQILLFEETKAEKKTREKKIAKLNNEIDKLKIKVEEIESGKIYENALEWRFEFPEVLNNDGVFVGFDVVIGNPPYFSLSKIKEKYQTAYFENNYQTYTKGSDIYCLFYEKGSCILRKAGFLTYITSNSWLKTIYGNSLKKYLIENLQPQTLLNIEDIQIFEEATVESNIIILKKDHANGFFDVASLKNNYLIGSSLEKYFYKHCFQFTIPNTSEWIIGNEESGSLKQKIEQIGKQLKDFKITINFGIKTGYNDAFIINEETKNQLIAESSNSAEIIQPILRGRDLKKYSYEFSNQWLICTFPSLALDITKYPAIMTYLEKIGKKRLAQSGIQGSRKKTNNQWFETQDSIAYWKDFEKPKIVWGEISDQPKFAFDDSNYYAEATTFLMTGEKLKYLLAILNSRLSQWYFNQISTTTGMGTNRWKKYKIEILPIKEPTEAEELLLETLVDQILTAKKLGLKADTTTLETEIDQLVYQLYELTAEEIKIIEG
ncbi:type II restriction endonuclease [Anabaena sp. UHCC 0253]|uniref:class I SAM-dependent DNA methyltransferase n=1 Tax=Anabaena sp. UHCC 0253 TaxID=2590019 RepID=UPI001447AEDF|nr:TaqI-like C-terminal specificity domain-containing protein [Anabaena sp. UHCC 0253]MTJ55584.1 type II restriction endonuclease [Anabaena sp. UHCC 0253]